MSPEAFYWRMGIWKFRIARVKNILARSRPQEVGGDMFLRDFCAAKADAQQHLEIDEAEFWRLVECWPKMEEDLFLARNDLDGFYRSWCGDAVRANICANLFNQFASYDIYRTVYHYAASSGRVLDYGCGTASMTLAHAQRVSGKAEFVLVELQEEVRDFIESRVNKHGLSFVRTMDVDRVVNERPFDLVMCIDVLEHLENPSEVLVENLIPRVRLGGILILRAPWRGQLTHIDAAPENFYRDGGRRALAKCFLEIERMGPNDVDAVYRRVR